MVTMQASHACPGSGWVEGRWLCLLSTLSSCLSHASSSLSCPPLFLPSLPLLSPTQSTMTTNISKKRKFIADGVFYAELNEVRAGRGLSR